MRTIITALLFLRITIAYLRFYCKCVEKYLLFNVREARSVSFIFNIQLDIETIVYPLYTYI